ncbi:MAG: alpha/beta hydrolase [Nitrososphaeraceae archaeon]|nr:alpha/beta hydrolase [Nitrososphaeraceae archaeon]
MALVITWNTVSWIQNSLTFNPKKVPMTHDYKLKHHEENFKTLINENVTLTEQFIDTSTDNTINAIYLKNPSKDICIIYAHGNSGTMETCMNFLYDFGTYANIMMFDYSGYGKSTGTPNSKEICDNAFCVWKYVVYTLKIKPENVILYGFSLGGSVVSHLAHKLNKNHPRAVIMQSSFSSSAEMAKQMLPKVAYHVLKHFMDHTLDSEKYLKKVHEKTKIIIIHSEEDEMIGFHHSKLLAGDKHDITIINGSHNEPELTKEFWIKFMECLRQ